MSRKIIPFIIALVLSCLVMVVACLNTKRNFIGIEKDDKYFDIAEKRIKNMDWFK